MQGSFQRKAAIIGSECPDESLKDSAKAVDAEFSFHLLCCVKQDRNRMSLGETDPKKQG